MSTSTNPLADLSNAGVSIWLDDLSRERIVSGTLNDLINEKHVVGVTTNPTIFAKAVAKGDQYDAQVAKLAASKATRDEAIIEITTHDVAQACDLFRPVYDQTAGFDGRVSIEVEPALAHDAAGTVRQAQQLADKVGRPNAYIKIPATLEGLEAITETIASGISVNVTLIFSLTRYREVINAYLSGLEKARANGIDLSTLHSVASFFVSRVDVEIDKRLDAIGTDAALTLKGKAGVANAQLAYEVYQQAFTSERATTLLAAGANKQRPLWASTGVKDPSLPDTMYVVELVAPEVVNTMPEKTLDAVANHGQIRGDTITGSYDAANADLDSIAAVGISYDDVTALLETEGVQKFADSWAELQATVDDALKSATTSASVGSAANPTASTGEATQ